MVLNRVPDSDKHLAPASSRCEHVLLVINVAQSTSLVSDPLHCKLLKNIGPVPWPNVAEVVAIVP